MTDSRRKVAGALGGVALCAVAAIVGWQLLDRPASETSVGAGAAAESPVSTAADPAAGTSSESAGTPIAPPSGVIRVSAVDAASREAVPGLPLVARRLGPDGEPVSGDGANAAVFRTVTDDAGAASFSALPLANYTIASDDDFLASRFLSFVLDESTPSADGVLEVVPGGRITGRVVNPAGVPVAGAVVVASPDFKAFEAMVRAFQEDPDDADPAELENLSAQFSAFAHPETETGEDGFFALRGVRVGTHRVSASHANYVTSHVESVEVVANIETSAGVIPLFPGASLVVRVESLAGEAIAGAEVALEPDAREGSPALPFLGVPVMVSGADGNARLAHATPGRYRLRVTHALHPPADPLSVDLLEGVASEATVRLEAGHALDGIVVDEAGRGVADASISLVQDALFRDARTDETGAFSFRGLAPKPVRLHVTAEEFAPMNALRAEPGASGLRFVLRRGGRLGGNVIAEDGTPATEFRIDVQMAGSDSFYMAAGARSKSFTAAEHGAFELSGLPGGRYRVIAKTEGNAPQSGEAPSVDLPDDGAVLNLVIRLGANRTVRGRVVAASTRDPVEGARVAASREPPPSGMSALFPLSGNVGDGDVAAWSDSDGAFEIEVDHSARVLKATAKGFVVSYADVPHPDSIDPVEIALRAGGRVEGYVFDGRGAPIEGGRVVLMAGMMPSKVAKTAPDGSFSMESVEPGEYTGGFVPPSDGDADRGDATDLDFFGSLRDTKPIVVVDSETTRADFGGAGRSGGRVHGYVVASGAAARDVEVFLVPGSGGGREANFAEMRRTVTNEEGYYAFADLRRGRYTVGADSGAWTIFENVTIADEPDVRLDLVAPDGSILVRVADAKTREPLAEVTVFVVPEGTGPIRSLAMLADGGFWQQTTNVDGEAVFERLRDGRYDVSAGEAEPFSGGSSRSYAIERTVAAISEGGAETVDLFLRPGLVLEGRVTGPEGEGVRAPIVSLFDESGRPVSGLFPTPGQDDGAYRLAGLSPGTYVARVSARGYAPIERGNVRVERAEGNRADFTLGPGGALAVWVVDASGRAVAGAEIVILDSAGRSVVESVSLIEAMTASDASFGSPPTDESGRTLREHLAPGRYAVTASIDGERESAPVPVNVSERVTTDVRVVLR